MSSLIGQRIGQTAALVALATVFAVLISLRSPRSRPRGEIASAIMPVRGVSVVGLGMPSFWIGIVLIEVFAVRLAVLPVGGCGSDTSRGTWSR